MVALASSANAKALTLPEPWVLPGAGLSVFYGRPEAPRLSHYFLPRVLMHNRRALYVDGANRFDPLLIARLARQRGRTPADFNDRVRVARAFTCFQLTELLARIPRLLDKFAADVLIVTGLPELYFDEDVREREAQVSFRRARAALNALRPLPLSIALFSDATSFQTPRRGMFRELTSQASTVWRFNLDGEGKPYLVGEKDALPLPA
jgi:Rad51